VSGQKFSIKSNRPNDRVESNGMTNKDGELIFTLTSRDSGLLKLDSGTANVKLSGFEINIKEAWYESNFLITGYNVCLEVDFSGALVEGNGLNEKHKDDFLYGSKGIPMQGTGKDTNEKVITVIGMSSGWHHNARGNPDRVENPLAVTFRYTDGVHGAFGDVKENDSIAVDPSVIPKKAKVDIDGVGLRWARDKGGKIKGYHIDNFLGFGNDVVIEWLKGGVNGTHRRIKYLGEG
jgi:3D (Asp-Asp-Asp) domain-containing protein